MSIQSKLALTVVAMLCTISVMAIGIWAVMSEFSVGVENNSKLIIVNIDGDLYASRKGASDRDFDNELIYSPSQNLNQSRADALMSDINFTNGLTEIEYVFRFVRNQVSESDTWINLEDLELSNGTYLNASYKYAQTEEEPNWENASNITGTIVVSQEKPYAWIRIALSVKESALSGVSEINGLTWSYTLNFFSNMQP